MAYPTLEQYNEALHSPQIVLQDPLLKRGVVRRNGMGMPLALCGGFALTYTIEVDGKKFAVRCFHKASQELERRYQAISARLAQLRGDYFLPFEFNPTGIRIGGQSYPVVKMAWAKGRTLAEFLEAEHRNAAALGRLRQALGTLAQYLEQNQISHGDIQPENVMVSVDGGSVQLIDYDGMYVEPLKGAKATELGQINFQHPKRSAANFSARLDRFSFLTLDVALQALIASPGLWTKSRSEPSAVVFRRSDFLDPGASDVFQEAVQVPGLKVHVENLAKVALSDFEAIPTLSDFLQGHGIPAGSIVIRREAAGPVVYQGAYPVCDATKFDSVLVHVSNRIELVGQIHSVKRDRAVNHAPYIFVNFSDWRGKAVKLAIWSDGIDAITPEVPDQSWIGRWVSVTGMVDVPFRRQAKTVSYTHLSITISARGQIQLLPETEARFRLGAQRPAGKRTASPSQDNSDVLKGMGGTPVRSSNAKAPASPPPQSTPPQSSNQRLLESMKRATPTGWTTSSSAPAPSPKSVPPPATTPATPAPTPAAKNSGCFPAVLWVGAALLLLRFLAG